MKPSDLRLVLMDDHRIVLEALELTLTRQGFNIVAAVQTADDALRVCLQHRPDILLADLLMPDGDGLRVARKVRARLPGCKVIILTGDRSPWHLARAKQAGVDGYLSKNVAADELEMTILDVAGGKRTFDPILISEATTVHGPRRRPFTPPDPDRPIDPLSDQENRVLKLISAGLSNAEIASLLNLSPHTIKAHVRHIFRKLGVTDRTSAAIWAIESGNVSMEETSPTLPIGGAD